MEAAEKRLRERVYESRNVENSHDWVSGKINRTYYDLYGKSRRYRGDGAKVSDEAVVRETKRLVEDLRTRVIELEDTNRSLIADNNDLMGELEALAPTESNKTLQEMKRKLGTTIIENMKLKVRIKELEAAKPEPSKPSQPSRVFVGCDCEGWKKHFAHSAYHENMDYQNGYCRDNFWTRCPFCESDKPLWRERKVVRLKRSVRLVAVHESADGWGAESIALYPGIQLTPYGPTDRIAMAIIEFEEPQS